MATPIGCLLMLMACGGGGQGAASDVSTAGSQALIVAAADGVKSQAAAAGDAAAPTPLVHAASGMTSLSVPDPAPGATRRGVLPTAACPMGFDGNVVGDAPSVAAQPDAGGVFYRPEELQTWRERVTAGPFVTAGDFAAGSPADWRRIRYNAALFAAASEPLLSTADDGQVRATHGSLARDAAFQALVTEDSARAAAVARYLVAQARHAANDFTRLCITRPDGMVLDAWWWHASWLLRYLATYDFVRTTMSAADRLVVERLIRRNAYFLAGHNDWGLSAAFPERQAGNYSARREDAAPASEAAIWWRRRFDTNNDCRIDGLDDPATHVARTHVLADGSGGHPVPVLTQYYNNRRSAAAAAVAVAGVTLGDATLIASAKRYFMEWLTFGVWPDGSQGEYVRNGDYCIAQQGVIYAHANVQGALMAARVLARQGDGSLFGFRTRDGLFGTESTGPADDKSLAIAAAAPVRLLLGQLGWFAYRPSSTGVGVDASLSLAQSTSRYLRAGEVTDNFHELGLLMAARQLPGLPIEGLVLRHAGTTSLPFPGATGHVVAAGYGSWVGAWNDYFNTLPSLLLMRP